MLQQCRWQCVSSTATVCTSDNTTNEPQKGCCVNWINCRREKEEAERGETKSLEISRVICQERRERREKREKSKSKNEEKFSKEEKWQWMSGWVENEWHHRTLGGGWWWQSIVFGTEWERGSEWNFSSSLPCQALLRLLFSPFETLSAFYFIREINDKRWEEAASGVKRKFMEIFCEFSSRSLRACSFAMCNQNPLKLKFSLSHKGTKVCSLPRHFRQPTQLTIHKE